MNTRVRRWGDSLAIRIPKTFAEEVGLQANDEVEITLCDGQIVVIARKTRSCSLEQLLEAITAENRPSEWDMGSAAGNEGW